ncbi:12906_t:CDS:2 [Ambispora gerdemannii]|uniref:12906_t:CDS:1 n=1 Tax=Ambispora gerdemannii TaxID=144530 RepID=A0A9N9A177_9GLOM|nr:12906_t:CDS:2 [Ambispora gerdemannii]
MEQGVPVNFFAVEPRKDCPHTETDVSFSDWGQVAVDVKQECQTCHDKEENWRCLNCQGVFCSSDLSTWCYACDDYITSPALRQIETSFAEIKFPDNAVITIGGGSSSSSFTTTPTTITINRGNGNVQNEENNSGGGTSSGTNESKGKKAEE